MSNPVPRIDRNSPRPLFGLSVSYPAPGILELIGPAWDWFWIDSQHGDLNFSDTVELVRTAEFLGIPAIVRVPGQDPVWVAKVLDAGAAGVIIPMVESLAEARAMVTAAKFPPQGNRSYGGLRIAVRAGGDYYKTANRDTVLIVQLESNRAVDLADKLAAIDGVDGLFLGPADLAIRNGYEVTVPKNMDTIGRQSEIVARACRRHRKLNVGLANDDVGLEMAKRLGHQLVVGTGDFFMLEPASAARIKVLHEAFGLGRPASRPPSVKRPKHQKKR